jgi:hypothetical protein
MNPLSGQFSRARRRGLEERERTRLAFVPALTLVTLAGGLIVGAAGPIAAEQARDQGERHGPATFEDPLSQLRTTVSTDRREYRRGRPVLIQMRLTNTGKTITLTNVQEYDVLVRQGHRAGPVISQWSWQFTRQGVPPRLPLLPPRTSFTLGRWQSRTNHAVWDQNDASGRPVPPGVYWIEARIYPHPQITPVVILPDAPGAK